MKTPKRFLGIDGESITLDGEHRYVLLMDSDGRSITNMEGLDTVQCLDFLLDCPRQSIPVGFGLNYDVNMMLRDMGRKRLEDLWSMGQTVWFHYQLEWIPGKWLRVHNRNTDQRVKVSEVFGFFQTSFVKALEKWGYTPPESMVDMKEARSEFTAGMLGEITAYCFSECQLLASMMEDLREAVADCGIKCSSWHGAGAIALGLFKQQKVKAHIVPQTEYPTEVQHAIMCAYFGGRTELFRQGEIPRVWQYDIMSAYPWAATFLPSLAGGRWIFTYLYNSHPHAVWHVRWHYPGFVGPFPVRIKGKRIIYPCSGEGWYHACEVQEAYQQGHLEILGGWVFEPATPGHPFGFIPELAAQKAEYKRQGHGGEKVLKLGINSLYGKLAQGKGYRDSLPPYQSYFWAGEITARTRSVMLRLTSLAPDKLVMIATDGIFFTDPIPVSCGNGLGDLELTRLDNMLACQPGVYAATVDGETYAKSRGFFVKEIDFDKVREGWREDGPYAIQRYNSTRFVGLGTALNRKDFGVWRTWHEGERKLTLYPSHKQIEDWSHQPNICHYPPAGDPSTPSLPYVPKLQGVTEDDLEYMQGKEQPLREDM